MNWKKVFILNKGMLVIRKNNKKTKKGTVWIWNVHSISDKLLQIEQFQQYFAGTWFTFWWLQQLL